MPAEVVPKSLQKTRCGRITKPVTALRTLRKHIRYDKHGTVLAIISPSFEGYEYSHKDLAELAKMYNCPLIPYGESNAARKDSKSCGFVDVMMMSSDTKVQLSSTANLSYWAKASQSNNDSKAHHHQRKDVKRTMEKLSNGAQKMAKKPSGANRVVVTKDSSIPSTSTGRMSTPAAGSPNNNYRGRNRLGKESSSADSGIGADQLLPANIAHLPRKRAGKPTKSSEKSTKARKVSDDGFPAATGRMRTDADWLQQQQQHDPFPNLENGSADRTEVSENLETAAAGIKSGMVGAAKTGRGKVPRQKVANSETVRYASSKSLEISMNESDRIIHKQKLNKAHQRGRGQSPAKSIFGRLSGSSNTADQTSKSNLRIIDHLSKKLSSGVEKSAKPLTGRSRTRKQNRVVSESSGTDLVDSGEIGTKPVESARGRGRPKKLRTIAPVLKSANGVGSTSPDFERPTISAESVDSVDRQQSAIIADNNLTAPKFFRSRRWAKAQDSAANTKAQDSATNTKAQDLATNSKAPELAKNTKTQDLSTNTKTQDLATNSKAPSRPADMKLVEVKQACVKLTKLQLIEEFQRPHKLQKRTNCDVSNSLPTGADSQKGVDKWINNVPDHALSTDHHQPSISPQLKKSKPTKTKLITAESSHHLQPVTAGPPPQPEAGPSSDDLGELGGTLLADSIEDKIDRMMDGSRTHDGGDSIDSVDREVGQLARDSTNLANHRWPGGGGVVNGDQDDSDGELSAGASFTALLSNGASVPPDMNGTSKVEVNVIGGVVTAITGKSNPLKGALGAIIKNAGKVAVWRKDKNPIVKRPVNEKPVDKKTVSHYIANRGYMAARLKQKMDHEKTTLAHKRRRKSGNNGCDRKNVQNNDRLQALDENDDQYCLLGLDAFESYKCPINDKSRKYQSGNRPLPTGDVAPRHCARTTTDRAASDKTTKKSCGKPGSSKTNFRKMVPKDPGNPPYFEVGSNGSVVINSKSFQRKDRVKNTGRPGRADPPVDPLTVQAATYSEVGSNGSVVINSMSFQRKDGVKNTGRPGEADPPVDPFVQLNSIGMTPRRLPHQVQAPPRDIEQPHDDVIGYDDVNDNDDHESCVDQIDQTNGGVVEELLCDGEELLCDGEAEDGNEAAGKRHCISGNCHCIASWRCRVGLCVDRKNQDGEVETGAEDAIVDGAERVENVDENTDECRSTVDQEQTCDGNVDGEVGEGDNDEGRSSVDQDNSDCSGVDGDNEDDDDDDDDDEKEEEVSSCSQVTGDENKTFIQENLVQSSRDGSNSNLYSQDRDMIVGRPLAPEGGNSSSGGSETHSDAIIATESHQSLARVEGGRTRLTTTDHDASRAVVCNCHDVHGSHAYRGVPISEQLDSLQRSTLPQNRRISCHHHLCGAVGETPAVEKYCDESFQILEDSRSLSSTEVLDLEDSPDSANEGDMSDKSPVPLLSPHGGRTESGGHNRLGSVSRRPDVANWSSAPSHGRRSRSSVSSAAVPDPDTLELYRTILKQAVEERVDSMELEIGHSVTMKDILGILDQLDLKALAKQNRFDAKQFLAVFSNYRANAPKRHSELASIDHIGDDVRQNSAESSVRPPTSLVREQNASNFLSLNTCKLAGCSRAVPNTEFQPAGQPQSPVRNEPSTSNRPHIRSQHFSISEAFGTNETNARSCHEERICTHDPLRSGAPDRSQSSCPRQTASFQSASKGSRSKNIRLTDSKQNQGIRNRNQLFAGRTSLVKINRGQPNVPNFSSMSKSDPERWMQYHHNSENSEPNIVGCCRKSGYGKISQIKDLPSTVCLTGNNSAKPLPMDQSNIAGSIITDKSIAIYQKSQPDHVIRRHVVGPVPDHVTTRHAVSTSLDNATRRHVVGPSPDHVTTCHAVSTSLDHATRRHVVGPLPDHVTERHAVSASLGRKTDAERISDFRVKAAERLLKVRPTKCCSGAGLNDTFCLNYSNVDHDPVRGTAGNLLRIWTENDCPGGRHCPGGLDENVVDATPGGNDVRRDRNKGLSRLPVMSSTPVPR